MSQSDFQKQFTGPASEYEFAQGYVAALRSFDVDRVFAPMNDREFVLRGHWGGQWSNGSNNAKCMRWSRAYNAVEAVNLFNERFNFNAASIQLDHNYEKKIVVESDWAAQAGLPDTYTNVKPIENSEDLVNRRMMTAYLDPCGMPGDLTRFDSCTCGFYGEYRDPADFYHYTGLMRMPIAAVVHHYGHTLLGERGLRSTKAKIVAATALFLEGDRVAYGSIEVYYEDLQRAYPDVEWYTVKDETRRLGDVASASAVAKMKMLYQKMVEDYPVHHAS